MSNSLYISAYLRASTVEQKADRARDAIQSFVSDHGVEVNAWYFENASGASLARPELMLLLERAPAGSVLLVEQVDRLSRLDNDGWEQLKLLVARKKLQIVSMDIPMTYPLLQPESNAMADEFTRVLFGALSRLMLDLLAAMARKDYEDRRRRQAEGVERARAEGKYTGRPRDVEKHKQIIKLRQSGLSIKDVAELLKVSTRTVTRVTNHHYDD